MQGIYPKPGTLDPKGLIAKKLMSIGRPDRARATHLGTDVAGDPAEDGCLWEFLWPRGSAHPDIMV